MTCDSRPRAAEAESLQSSALGRGLALMICLACLPGCSESERPKTIPISGRVTIDGQAPGEFGKLFFTPTQAAEGYVKRPASGTFGPEGDYRVMSWAPDDGLVPGHYQVNIMPGDSSKTKIPSRYQNSSTSGLEVNVPVDLEEIEYDIEIRK